MLVPHLEVALALGGEHLAAHGALEGPVACVRHLDPQREPEEKFLVHTRQKYVIFQQEK